MTSRGAFIYDYCHRFCPALRFDKKCKDLRDLIEKFEDGRSQTGATAATATLLRVARDRDACALPKIVIRCRLDVEHLNYRDSDGCKTVAPKPLLFPLEPLPSVSAVDNGLLWLIVEFRDDRRGKFCYALAGFVRRSEVMHTSRGRIVLDDTYSPLQPYYTLNDEKRKRFCTSLELAPPVSTAFPMATTEEQRSAFDVDALRSSLSFLFSFCVRWHCAKNTVDSQRREMRTESMDANLRAPSLKYCRGRPTENALFGEIASFGALTTLTVAAQSDPLAHFVRAQWLGALKATWTRWLGEATPLRAAPAVAQAIRSLLVVRSGLLGYRSEEAHNERVVWHDVDAVCVRLLLDDRTAELSAFLWPSSSTLAAGCVVRDGVVSVRGGRQQALLLCDVAERFLVDLRERVPGATAQAMRDALRQLDFDVDELFRVFDDARPRFGHFYASDRSTKYDDVAARTIDCVGLRLASYSAPRVNGLERDDEQMQRLRDSEAAARYSILCSDGVRRAVPVRSLHTLMHRREDDAVRSGDADQLARSAERMRQPLNRSSSVPSAAYTEDADAAIASDVGFRRWMRERCTLSNGPPTPTRPRRQRVEVAFDGEDGSSESATPPSPESVRRGSVTDIYQNVYENGGMPLCVLGYARDNANGERPRDAARMNYFPFLRSLQLPGVSTREVVVHLMKNVSTSQFAEYYNRLTRTHPEKFRRSRERSEAALLARGRDPATAEREASCFPRCSTKRMRKTCPFAVDGGADVARVASLRRQLRAAGVEQVRAETIVRAACAERPGEACRQFFIATRPAPLHAAGVPPFPGEHQVYINTAREFTYLAAAHMHASLRAQPGYASDDFVDIEELAAQAKADED